MEPKLVLQKQESLKVERLMKNGVLKDIHIVVKGLPFCLDVVGKDGLSIRKQSIQTQLLYDDQELFTVVEGVLGEPFEAQIFSNTQNNYSIECRVKALTSQHAKSLFRIMVDDSNTGKSFSILSKPIKVISKPLQPKLIKKRPSTTVQSLISSKKSKKENLLSNILTQFEEQNKIYQETLQILAKNQVNSFDKIFFTFLNTFQALNPQEKRMKAEKILSNISSEEKQIISSIISTLKKSIEEPTINILPDDQIMQTFLINDDISEKEDEGFSSTSSLDIN